MKLAAGSYFVGFDRPMLASDDMIRAGLAGLGLELVRIVPRTSSTPPVNPRTDPAYSDAWDQWLELRVPRELELERPDRVRWVVPAPSSGSSGTPAPTASSSPGQQVPSSSAPSSAPVARGASSGLGLVLVLLVLGSSRRRRRYA